MKAFFCILLSALLALCAVGGALAAPELTGVFASDAWLTSGQAGWFFQFNASEGGAMALRLLSAQTGETVADLGAVRVEAGDGRVDWDGLLADGSAAQPGTYMLAASVRNDAGEESAQSLLSVQILEPGDAWQATVLSVDEEPAREIGAVPVATSFWDMDPDAYDLTNPEHQQAIWALMMQPITVLNVGQTEHVYPTNQPGISRTPYKDNCAGELHGQSQGVHVLEEDLDGDGYLLIEAYSNDGTKTDSEYMELLDAKLIQGYVKKSLLFEVTPSSKYALLIDKLRQKLFIFEAGAIIGSLDISTGLNNEKQPYNETPAGEFITISRVGEFVSGTMRADYAIRINGGTLLHEVPYRYGADGKTKLYAEFEGEIGRKASHACIRIQRRKNANGQNMAWLWSNLELKTKVFVWDDQGRRMYDPELPDPGTQLFRNPNGGSNYHLVEYCSGVKDKYLPLTGDFTYGQLGEDEFSRLTPCPYCGAPQTPKELYARYAAAAEQIGAEITDEVRAQFGL